MSRGQCGLVQQTQQMESISCPQRTLDLRTFCLLAASKHISRLEWFVLALPDLSRSPSAQPVCVSSGAGDTECQAGTSSCGDQEQPGSDRRHCGIEDQQIYPALAAG